MAIPLDQFMRQLTESGLMLPEALQAWIATMPSEGQPRDGDQLARELVRQQKLTPFQAQAVYQGKGQGLVMGNYVILDKLGQGGMGAVFKAEHRRMRRIVALKVVSPAAMKSPDAVRRFVREVEAAAKLTHPNIVIAYDADEAAGKRFLVMEYVAGSDLAALVKKQGPLPVAKAVNCILQAARGLQFAHEQGVIHRDIKPANLLVDGKGTVKILDMGLARLDSAGARQDDLTGTGQIMGTVDYMAPEQALNTKLADQRADVYSLGITLWFLLTGRATYDGDSVMAKLLAHRDQATPSLREARPEVPAALDAVFAKMVAKKPDDRFQSMSAVIAALEGGSSEPVSAVILPAAQSDDSQLNDFLNGPPRTGASAAGSVAPAKARQAGRTAVARDETISRSAVDADTDPQTQLRLPSATTRTGARQRKSAALRPWWQDWRVKLGGRPRCGPGVGGLGRQRSLAEGNARSGSSRSECEEIQPITNSDDGPDAGTGRNPARECGGIRLD